MDITYNYTVFCAIRKHISFLKSTSLFLLDSWVIFLWRSCLFMCLWTQLVNFSLKRISSYRYRPIPISSLVYFAFGLCFAWRFGDFCFSGAFAIFYDLGLYFVISSFIAHGFFCLPFGYVTCVDKMCRDSLRHCDVTITGSTNYKISVEYLRMRRSEAIPGKVTCTPPFVNYVIGLKDSLPPWSCWNNSQIAVYLMLGK